MRTRRAFIGTLGLGLLTAPHASEAQPVGKVYKIGFLSPLPGEDPALGPLLQGLRDLGYDEGRNLVVERRDAGGRREYLPILASELADRRIDLLVSSGSAATVAAKTVSPRLPVAFVSRDLGDSPTRAGGNLTGVALTNPEISAKWVELIHDALPAARRVAILWDPTSPRTQLTSAEATAKSLGLVAGTIVGHTTAETDAAFEAATKQRAEAIVVLSSASFAYRKQQLVALPVRHHLPGIYDRREFVEAGGLMALGPAPGNVGRLLAAQVDKILKGAKPGDLPVEQPTKFELVINLKTAKALGLTIPPSLLGRADELIQ
jgi:putative tryptophan/tyrosine transport system substrate-binding protein